jgi:hypothetical protein
LCFIFSYFLWKLFYAYFVTCTGFNRSRNKDTWNGYGHINDSPNYGFTGVYLGTFNGNGAQRNFEASRTLAHILPVIPSMLKQKKKLPQGKSWMIFENKCKPLPHSKLDIKQYCTGSKRIATTLLLGSC